MNTVERVKNICKERHIPISKIEKDLGFANGYIGQLKKGVFPDDRLALIADYLNLSIDYLLGKTDTKKEGPAEADPIGYDDFGYAMYMEGRELTEENKAKLLEMAKFFKQQQEKENEQAK